MNIFRKINIATEENYTSKIYKDPIYEQSYRSFHERGNSLSRLIVEEN